MKLSIVMVSASFHPYVGGAEKQALELSVALMRRGHDVTVLTRGIKGQPCRDTIRGVPVVRLPALGFGLMNSLSFLVSLGLYLLAAGRRYHVIHAHLAGSPALAAIAAGALLGRPVVIKLGGGRGVGELSGSAGTWPGRLKLRLLDKLKPQFVAVSRELEQELEAYGVHGARLRHIPNGVDTERYHPSLPEEKRRVRQAWGWPEGLCFLYVGRLSPEKRLPMFLEAWLEASTGEPSSYCVFIGEGSEEERLRALASKHRERVLVLPPMDAVHEAYAAADVFVLPSKSEGLSNALLEAMASGLAILASRVGGTAEVISDGVSGLLFSPSDMGQLRERIKVLLKDPATRGAIGRKAREQAERYSIDRSAAEYEALYSQR